MVKTRPASAGDKSLILDTGRSPREENGNPLQYPCLENSTDRGDLPATICGATKSRTCLSIHTHKVNMNPGLLNNLFNKLFSNLSASSPEKYCQLNY